MLSPSVVAAPAPIRSRGIPPLALLTTVNFFNYLDRQVVYGMASFIQTSFGLTKARLGLLALVNLAVFAVASLTTGPIADRLGPRRVIFAGVLIWAIATIGSALATSFPMLLMFRALVGVGEGSYGPSANALLCAVARPNQQGRALGIYNAGMAVGGSAGLLLGSALAPTVGWRGVFWIAGAPSLLLALMCAFIAAPPRLAKPQVSPRASGLRFLMSPTFLMCLAGGVLVTFASSALLFWASTLIIDERHFSRYAGGLFMFSLGVVGGIGGVVTGGIVGDAFAQRRAGGHARVMGLALLIAVPTGIGCLLTGNKALFAVCTGLSVFLLSAYNGPAAVVVDQLAPPRRAATVQAVYMFAVHVIGDAPAAAVVGFIAGYATLAHSLLIAVLAYAISGVLLLAVSRRQRRDSAMIQEAA